MLKRKDGNTRLYYNVGRESLKRLARYINNHFDGEMFAGANGWSWHSKVDNDNPTHS